MDALRAGADPGGRRDGIVRAQRAGPRRIMSMTKDPCIPRSAPGRWRASRCLRVLSTAALGAGLLLAAAGEAHAQQPPPPDQPHYVVLTNDGSRFEGELVERVVGSHVTIKLVTGDIRTIQAADVKAEWRPGQGPVGVPIGGVPPGLPTGIVLTPPPLVPGVPLAYHGPDELQIHLTNVTNERGTLYHESASGWEEVCQMPCTTTVDPKTSYRIHNSDAVRFPSGPGSLDLVADIGSRQRNKVVGTWLLVIGAALVPLGALLTVGIIDGHIGAATTTDKVAGGTMLAACGGLVVAGIVLLAVGPTSTLTTTSGQRIAREPSLRLPGGLALTPSGVVF
jgi:hypothetical protein